jgi:hypothetical protein
MTSWIPLPQNNVVTGQSGHETDHDDIYGSLNTLWSAAMQSFFNVCHPTYGADPTGVADSTTAIQNAINAADAANGVVCIPAGTYKVAPGGSSTAALTLNNGTTGYNVRIVGAGAESTVLQRSAAGPILAMAGPATDTTGATHCKYSSLEAIGLNGNSLTGKLVQCYYADNLFFQDVRFTGCNDVVIDTAEFWDSRFYNCVWEVNGSTTANTPAPNVQLRNSAASSGFGASTDNVNQIHFVGCRWEGFRTGAVTIGQGVGNTNTPNGIYLVNCKMETGSLNGNGIGGAGGGSHLTVDANSKAVYVENLYLYSGGFYPGYSTAQDAIAWSPQDGALGNVFIATGASQTVANGVTVTSTVSTQNSVVRNVTGIYNGAPTGQHINVAASPAGSVTIDNCNSNQTVPAWQSGQIAFAVPATTNSILDAYIPGDTFARWVAHANGTLFWGSGSATYDVEVGRTAAGVFSMLLGIFDAQHGTKTTAGAAVLTPTFASGTAAQLSDTTRDYQVYFTVGTAGSAFSVAIGPTSTPANTIVSSNTPNAGESISFRLPAGWFVKWAGTSTTLANQIAIGC